jgi:hypothetical protein
MDEEFSQLRHREQEKEAARVNQAQEAVSEEFDSVEEALRVDRERTTLPSQLAARVSKATRNEPVPPSSWWARWFKRG